MYFIFNNLNSVIYFVVCLSLISGGSTVIAINPMHSILFLISTYALTSIIMLMLGADFFAFTMLIVYVGAIAILFLFVVMMMELRVMDMFSVDSDYLVESYMIGIFYLTAIFRPNTVSTEFFFRETATPYLFNLTSYCDWGVVAVQKYSSAHTIGYCLYNFYFFIFIIASLLLLVAMLGAIVLTINYKADDSELRITINKKINSYIRVY